MSTSRSHDSYQFAYVSDVDRPVLRHGFQSLSLSHAPILQKLLLLSTPGWVMHPQVDNNIIPLEANVICFMWVLLVIWR